MLSPKTTFTRTVHQRGSYLRIADRGFKRAVSAQDLPSDGREKGCSFFEHETANLHGSQDKGEAYP